MIRRGGQLDVPFMRSMLTHAYNWHVTVFDTEVPLARYVDGWGRPGDTALIAIEAGHRLGAGWYRLFRESAPGFGFVDERTPEVTVAVVPGRRGEGIGQELLSRLLETARAAGYASVSASVEQGHPELAAYAEAGFEEVRQTENAVVLLRPLEAAG
jgi:GNAT superfamily N-acetyltransferase